MPLTMLRRIEPEVIICYHNPFPEMQGNIVYVDYDLSSWKHDEDDLDKAKTYRITKHTGYVVLDKGGGSAEGGQWQPNPNKPTDARFLGEPEKVVDTIMRNSERVSTRIGEDGRGAIERHWTDHNQPWAHTNPHDHYIIWDPYRGTPSLGPPINYPDGAPDFKHYKVKQMSRTIDMREYPDDILNFETISEFKWCLYCGGEIAFDWNGKSYGVTHRASGEIGISEDYKQETEKLCKDADEVLKYLIDGVRLREIITQVEVTDRTI